MTEGARIAVVSFLGMGLPGAVVTPAEGFRQNGRVKIEMRRKWFPEVLTQHFESAAEGPLILPGLGTTMAMCESWTTTVDNRGSVEMVFCEVAEPHAALRRCCGSCTNWNAYDRDGDFARCDLAINPTFLSKIGEAHVRMKVPADGFLLTRVDHGCDGHAPGDHRLMKRRLHAQVVTRAEVWSEVGAGLGGDSMRLPHVLAILDPPATEEELLRYAETGEIPARTAPADAPTKA